MLCMLHLKQMHHLKQMLSGMSFAINKLHRLYDN